MDAKQYYEANGTKKTRAVIERAGTSWGYFMHIINGRRRVSPELAERLEMESGGEMDFISLLKPKQKLIVHDRAAAVE